MATKPSPTPRPKSVKTMAKRAAKLTLRVNGKNIRNIDNG